MAIVHFNLDVEPLADNAARLRVDGELDAHTCEAMVESLEHLLDYCCFIVVDLRGLTYMSSAGASALVNASVTAHARNGKLVLANLKPGIRQVFFLLGLDGVVTIADSEAAVVEQMQT